MNKAKNLIGTESIKEEPKETEAEEGKTILDTSLANNSSSNNSKIIIMRNQRIQSSKHKKDIQSENNKISSTFKKQGLNSEQRKVESLSDNF